MTESEAVSVSVLIALEKKDILILEGLFPLKCIAIVFFPCKIYFLDIKDTVNDLPFLNTYK